MTATRASLSSLSDVVREAYGIPEPAFVPLGGGYQNELWRAGDVVVRVERAAPESVAWEHALVRFLGDRVDEVVAPIEGGDGQTFVELDGRIVSVWPYVEGSPARRRHHPHALVAAKLLATLHRAGTAWMGGQRPGAQAIATEGVHGPIHGDFYRGNVLMRRGRIAGVVDWEESHIDRLDYELASAVWEFCVSKREHDFDRRLAVTMLEAYGSDLTPDELVPLILKRVSYELEVWAADSDERYRTHLRRSVQRLGG